MNKGTLRLSPRLIVGLLLLSLAAGAALAQTAPAAKLTIEISGVHPGKGPVRVALWRNVEKFFKGPAYRRSTVPSSASTVTVEFMNLEPGEYAVSAYQDENDNGKLDTGFMGKPKEAYGFSNDARGTFGPPPVQAAAFKLNGDTKAISFRLK